MEKCYAVVGNWSFQAKERGISVYRYDTDSCRMELLKKYDPEINVGYQYYDAKRSVLYIVEEREESRERLGPGYVWAYSLNKETGNLSLLNKQCVMLSKPCYFSLDISGEYALVAAHTGKNGINKLMRQPDGTLVNVFMYEDAGVILLRIREDGSLGEVCDAALYSGITPLANQIHSHIHSVAGSKDCSVYYACDKGLDMIYGYHIDREKGKLIHLTETKMGFGTAPRYIVFHPALPILYENNETSRYLFAFRYEEKAGALEEISKVALWDDGENGVPSDLIINREGTFLYAAVRSINQLVVFACDKDMGILKKIQTIPSGKGPRGLTISPDGRYLFSANNDGNEIRIFEIREDGTLADGVWQMQAPYAGNIEIISCQK